MKQFFLLLFLSISCIGMTPPEPPRHHKKIVGGITFSGHAQDQMEAREITEISILSALAKGVYSKETDDIHLCIYKPEQLTVVVANKDTIVTAYRNKTLEECQKKLRLIVDLKGEAGTATEFKLANLSLKWANSCIAHMKQRHMTKNLVRRVIQNGTAYPTYTGSKLFVSYPYAVLYKDDTVTNVFAGINRDKVIKWIKERNMVMDKNCPSYTSNHPITAKSIRKKINRGCYTQWDDNTKDYHDEDEEDND